MRVTLKSSVILFFAYLAVMAALAWRSTRREIGAYEDRTREELVAVGDSLRELFVDVARDEGDTAGAAAVDRIGARLQHASVRWIDAASNGSPAASRALTTDRIESALEPSPTSRGRMTVYVPVRAAAGERRVIAVSEPLDFESDIVSAIARERVIESLALLALVTVLALGVGALVVGRPVKALVAHARRVAAGDLTARVTLGGRDELSLLACEMNGMTAELATAREQLRHADRLRTIGELASGIAHDMGTPLNVVSGRAKLIARGDLEPAEVQGSAEIIRQQADRIVATIRQLLDFARRDTASRAAVPLAETARSVARILASLAKEAGVTIVVEGEDDVETEGNVAEIEQLVTNLVVNAVHASPQGSEVRVRVAREAGGARIDVIDRGHGIAPEDREHVFEPFFTTKRAGEGTGLGLSIVAEIARAHGGAVALESTPGAGTTFTLRLPAR
jgi:signal transduction histidine kinase